MRNGQVSGAGVGKVILFWTEAAVSWELLASGQEEQPGVTRSVLGSIMLGVLGFWAPSHLRPHCVVETSHGVPTVSLKLGWPWEAPGNSLFLLRAVMRL